VAEVAVKRSAPEAELELQMRAVGLHPAIEHRFDETRRWRFDAAFPSERVAVEIEGAVWTQGRHTRGSGFVADLSKYNAAALAGWCVLRVTPQMVKSGEALRLIEAALRGRAA